MISKSCIRYFVGLEISCETRIKKTEIFVYTLVFQFEFVGFMMVLMNIGEGVRGSWLWLD